MRAAQIEIERMEMEVRNGREALSQIPNLSLPDGRGKLLHSFTLFNGPKNESD